MTGLLASGENKLEVIIRSAVLETQKKLLGTISLGDFAAEESIYARKAPSQYGWDIMPRLVSAGLWRSVTLEVLPPVHIRDAHWMTARADAGAGTATVFCDWTVSLPVRYQDGAVKATVRLSKDGATVYEHTRDVTLHSFRQKINLENIEFWWPRGYGEPALYDAEVILTDARTGDVMDRDSRKIGIRTIQLDFTPTHSAGRPALRGRLSSRRFRGGRLTVMSRLPMTVLRTCPRA